MAVSEACRGGRGRCLLPACTPVWFIPTARLQPPAPPWWLLVAAAAVRRSLRIEAQLRRRSWRCPRRDQQRQQQQQQLQQLLLLLSSNRAQSRQQQQQQQQQYHRRPECRHPRAAAAQLRSRLPARQGPESRRSGRTPWRRVSASAWEAPPPPGVTCCRSSLWRISSPSYSYSTSAGTHLASVELQLTATISTAVVRTQARAQQ
jgi:hypothetical protein